MQLLVNEVDPSELIEVRLEKTLTDDEYFDFCMANDHLRIERTAEREIVIMSPTGSETSNRNFNLGVQLGNWAIKDGRGEGFDSNAEFILPNGAALSPDTSWISHERLAKLTKAQKRKFIPLCPDFVVELTSPSNRLRAVKRKMVEWMENGAQLGWLIDPERQTVIVYRPNQEPQEHEGIDFLAGEGPVAGFEIDLRKIWKGL
jgi:Uma2 family endonuclease